MDSMKIKTKTQIFFLFVIPTVFLSCGKTNQNYGGINLYTFREELKTNPKEVLKSISDIGYRDVEEVGYSDRKFYGMTLLEYKEYLSEIGMVPISSHQSGITFDNADETIEDLKQVGYQYLVIPVPPMGRFTFNPDTREMGMTGGADSLAQVLNALGKKCDDAGLKLLYHNHDFEFRQDENGIVPIDYLLEHTDPRFVNFELDLYWAAKAGADPLAYFEKYPGRFKAWHLKDLDEQGRFAPVGKGQLDFAKYLAKKDLAGMKYYFVEQDMTFDGMTPYEAVKISHAAINGLGFEIIF